MRLKRARRSRLFRPILRPQAGRRLPRELNARNVGKLAAGLAAGLEDPRFEVLLRRIDTAPVLGGHEVVVHTRGEEAFADMTAAVRGAEREILLESYIVRDDRSGQAVLAELTAAAARGVTVRFLADALGSYTTRAGFWAELARRGVAVRLFHPLFQALGSQLFRDHRKILVVDRRVAFTGGMNIGEEYGAPRVARPKRRRLRRKPAVTTWRDTQVRLTGPAAWELAVVFSEGWRHADGEPFEIEPLDGAAGSLPGARVLVLDSRPGRGAAEAAAALAAVVGAARSRVWITNAYFAPGHTAVRVLGDAARRGVDVRLLLQGATDSPVVRHAGHGYFAPLLAQGVRIFEYEGSILHAKTLVADGYVSLVGSTNLDFRSFVFNGECNVLILDHPAAAALEHAFVADLECAREITWSDWRRRPFVHRLGDRLARLLTPLL